ncbi:MAG: EFR1 family ferrodoxin [Bacteroidales bacterium]|nr:EFR1 family ferrodoxin [Bacteroidales bacterium]
MIIWFSGTGNSQWVAEQLAEALNERMVSAAEALTGDAMAFSLAEGERLGFVFPTYSWGPAPVMLELVEKMQLQGVPSFCCMVTTCGDDIGLSADIMRKALAKRGITMHSAHSVQMPNNYVNMKGFDVDTDEVRRAKLEAAPARVARVAADIAGAVATVDVVTGGWAWAKSHIVRPWFVRHAMSDAKFRVEADACTHCGACVKHCPMHNITLTAAGTPEWHGRCAMCLSCLHRCPARAIQYAKATQNKGRYYLGKV